MYDDLSLPGPPGMSSMKQDYPYGSHQKTISWDKSRCQRESPAHSLEASVSSYNENERPFTCQLCGKGFFTQTGLNLHVQAHGGRQFSCPICDSKFKQKGHLKTHLQRIHKLAQCQSCLATFPLGMEFNQHILTCQ